MLVTQRSDGTWLCDRATLALWLHRSPETIRKRCPVAAYDAGRALYDMEGSAALLERVPTRGLTSRTTFTNT